MASENSTPNGVVITGASTGIGEACALRLDRAGFRVFAGVRKAADGEALTAKASARLTPILLDVIDAVSIAKAVDVVKGAVGPAGLAGLVNNAGIAVGGPLEEMPLADLRQQMEVNVIGQIAVTQVFLPLLRQGHGRIVNMGSIAGRSTMPFFGPYSASKYALEALTDALRLELAPWGIQVSIVEPGAIATPIWTRSKAAADERVQNISPEGRARYARQMAIVREVVGEAERRAIPPEAVADTVLRALTAKRPKTRYLVGMDAKLRIVMKTLLSDRLQDALLARVLGLPKKL